MWNNPALPAAVRPARKVRRLWATCIGTLLSELKTQLRPEPSKNPRRGRQSRERAEQLRLERALFLMRESCALSRWPGKSQPLSAYP